MDTTSPKRRVEYLPLGEIARAGRNPKEHDIPGIRRAFEEFGCTIAGVLDERSGRLVAGHGRLDTLELMHDEGAAPPEGIQTGDSGQWLIPIVRGWSSDSDAQAKAYVIADNHLNERGGWDERSLAEELEEIADFNVDLMSVTGYTADDLDDLLASFGSVQLMPQGETGARYAESEAEFAERSSEVTQYNDRKSGGAMAEMILVFPLEDHTVAIELIKRIRTRDGDQPVAQVVLAALRAHAGDDD